MQNSTVTVPQAGEVSQSGFGTNAIERKAETASLALAEQAKAAVQARYIMAMQRPRSLILARERLLADCKRPMFADAAIYHKPVGKGLEGPSIRMAEAATRALTNILTSATAVYDDESKRIIHISATDLEANVTYDADVVLAKTVERSKVPAGRKCVSSRINSNGETTYTIVATDEEIIDKVKANVSKEMRTCLLRLVPGDLLDEAMKTCYATLAQKDAEDPDAAAKEMCDSFADLGVGVAMLTDYLGHDPAKTTPAEMRRLRGIFNAIKAEETTWTEVLLAKVDEKKPEQKQNGDSGKQEAQGGDKPKATSLSDVAAKSRASRVTLEMPPEPNPIT